MTAGSRNKTAGNGKRKGKKKGAVLFIKCFLAAVLLAAVVLSATNAWVFFDSSKEIVARQDAARADAIIVPGALVWQNGQPSEMLQDRLDVACQLYRAGVAPKILVSGDHGSKDYDEPDAMRRYLESKGVPTEDIFMDYAGFDTYSTMYRARDIFKVGSAVVVTQKYHLYRAVFLARSMGIAVQGVACDRYKSPMQFYYDLREILARTKDFFYALVFKPEPMYLGDTMPISGNGIATHGE